MRVPAEGDGAGSRCRRGAAAVVQQPRRGAPAAHGGGAPLAADAVAAHGRRRAGELRQHFSPHLTAVWLYHHKGGPLSPAHHLWLCTLASLIGSWQRRHFGRFNRGHSVSTVVISCCSTLRSYVCTRAVSSSCAGGSGVHRGGRVPGPPAASGTQQTSSAQQLLCCKPTGFQNFVNSKRPPS